MWVTKRILALVTVLMLVTGLAACSREEASAPETVVEQVQQQAEAVADAVEEAAHDAADLVDEATDAAADMAEEAMDAIEDAGTDE